MVAYAAACTRTGCECSCDLSRLTHVAAPVGDAPAPMLAGDQAPLAGQVLAGASPAEVAVKLSGR